MFMYFSFNIWHEAVAYIHSVTTEQCTKCMSKEKVLFYKVQEIIHEFCFDINTKRRVAPKKILFSITFIVADIFVCGVILQNLPIVGFC